MIDHSDDTSSSDNESAPALVHEPIRPTRPDILGEVAFFSRWLDLMNDHDADFFDPDSPSTPLERILCDYRWDVDQRCATVCASFIQWLGTNNGRAFIHETRHGRLTDVIDSSGVSKIIAGDVWLQKWSVWNARKSYYNSGVRCLEAILAPAENTRPNGSIIPSSPSIEDYEVIEHLVCWFGDGEGNDFLYRVERDIQRLLLIQRLNRGGPMSQSSADIQKLLEAHKSADESSLTSKWVRHALWSTTCTSPLTQTFKKGGVELGFWRLDADIKINEPFSAAVLKPGIEIHLGYFESPELARESVEKASCEWLNLLEQLTPNI